MNGRQRAHAILSRRGEEAAAWMGHPSKEIIPVLATAWGVAPEREALARRAGDDLRWIPADSAWRPGDPRPLFGPRFDQPGAAALQPEDSLVGAETPAQVARFRWPSAADCDFTGIWQAVESHPEQLVMTGMWSPLFHHVADIFGMERYFILMHENPALVDAVTERVTDFLVEANDRFWQGVRDPDAVMFFGNDFGSQLDLLISPAMFRRFVLPSLKRVIDSAKRHGRLVAMHSCGAVARILPDLIDAGIDALHPLQARARGMSADALAQYRGHLAFIGGIDAQGLLPFGTPAQVQDEVRRVHGLLGPNLIVSPSHEELLPNVPPENILAMMEAARAL